MKTIVDAFKFLLVVAVIVGGALLGYKFRFPMMKLFHIKPKRAQTASTTIYTCGMHPQVRETEPGICPICQMKLTPVGGGKKKKRSKSTGKRKVMYWRAPMNPEEIYDEPGKTVMGMDRVPVYADMDASAIVIDPEVVQTHGVRYVTVKKQALSMTITAVGHVDYDETTVRVITARVSGWIERLYVDYEGKQITRGNPLIALYSPTLISTQEEFLLALKYRRILKDKMFKEILKGAGNLLQMTRQRLRLWDISKGQLQRLERTGRVKRRLVLYAKHSGTVIKKPSFRGRYIHAGTELFRIADLSKVWVYAHLYHHDLQWIRLNQEVEMEVEIDAASATSRYVARRFRGKITYIYPFMDQKTRTLRIRMAFDNAHGLLKPGMYTTVKIRSTQPAALVLPNSAILRSGKRDLVLLSRGHGRFLPREVQLGVRDGSGAQVIRKGLKENDKVVRDPQFLIDSESRLAEALQKFLPWKKPKSMGKPTSKPATKPTSQPTRHSHD